MNGLNILYKLFRAIQEGLGNCLAHSRSNLVLLIQRHGSLVEMSNWKQSQMDEYFLYQIGEISYVRRRWYPFIADVHNDSTVQGNQLTVTTIWFSSSTIIDALSREAQKLQIQVMTNAAVTEIHRLDPSLMYNFKILYSKSSLGEKAMCDVLCDKVICATGSSR